MIREREKQQRYNEIVDAAEKVFLQRGFAATSMDEIARQAQLSRALLYVYFKDKSAILRAVMLRALQSMEALQKGIRDGNLDPGHVDDALLTAYILQGSLHGVIMSLRNPKSPDMRIPDSRKLVTRAIQMMCYAMKA